MGLDLGKCWNIARGGLRNVLSKITHAKTIRPQNIHWVVCWFQCWVGFRQKKMGVVLDKHMAI